MPIDIERQWYSRSYTLLTLVLLPFSWLFYAVSRLRYLLYRKQILKTVHFSIPIIIVGNITVGGTGKTPLVIWLAQYLRSHGYKPGIVSRGIGGVQSKQPIRVQSDSFPAIVGDEALLLFKRTQCPVMLCVDRVAAVAALLNETDCDIIISDDGLQHYRLNRDIEIAVVDGLRRFGNQCLLPAGPLREPVSRLDAVDFVMVQGSANYPEFSMQLQGDELVSLKNPTFKKALPDLACKKIHAVAAIGNPTRFFATLRNAGIEVIEHRFKDHYLYKASDFAFADDLPIVMTEKDAVKCELFADERFWYLPVSLCVDLRFENELLTKINSSDDKY